MKESKKVDKVDVIVESDMDVCISYWISPELPHVFNPMTLRHSTV